LGCTKKSLQGWWNTDDCDEAYEGRHGTFEPDRHAVPQVSRPVFEGIIEICVNLHYTIEIMVIKIPSSLKIFIICKYYRSCSQTWKDNFDADELLQENLEMLMKEFHQAAHGGVWPSGLLGSYLEEERLAKLFSFQVFTIFNLLIVPMPIQEHQCDIHV